MKVFSDYLPIICFFVAYKLYGIYVATAATIAISFVQVTFFWFKNRRIETIPLVTLIMVTLLGGSTLLLHDEIFIKWKPSIVYWIFAVALVVSQCFTKKTIMERMMGEKMELPKAIWSHINLAWGLFFLILGFINLYVVYHYSTDAWVNFKLFGTLGLIFVFAVLQALYIGPIMAKHIKNNEDTKSQPSQTSE